jgi:pyruvate kinase
VCEEIIDKTGSKIDASMRKSAETVNGNYPIDYQYTHKTHANTMNVHSLEAKVTREEQLQEASAREEVCNHRFEGGI